MKHKICLKDIPISLIDQLDNSRLRIEQKEIAAKMATIKVAGLLQPISVFQKGNRYVLRMGNRRLEACKKLGWKNIPALVLPEEEMADHDFMADNVIENYHRVDLTPIELARAVKQEQKKGLTLEEISVKLSIPIRLIKSWLGMIEAAPESFKTCIRAVKGNSSKQGTISTAIANEIMTIGINERNQMLKPKQKDKLLGLAKKNKINKHQVRVIKNLMVGGMSFNTALKESKEYEIYTTELCLSVTALKKYPGISKVNLIRGFIEGSIKPNKKLLAA